MNQAGNDAFILAATWPIKHKTPKCKDHPLHGYAFPARIDLPPMGSFVFISWDLICYTFQAAFACHDARPPAPPLQVKIHERMY